VAGSIHHAVRSTADHVAEDSQKLKEDGGRVGLGVWSDGADSESGGTVETDGGQLPRQGGAGGPTGIVERRWSGGGRIGPLPYLVVSLLPLLVIWLMAELEQLSGAALYIRKGWERGPWDCAGAR
jgi:hypothetical protein